MIPDRYPAPGAALIFSNERKFAHWKYITDVYAHQLIEELQLEDYTALHRALDHTQVPTEAMVGEYEQELGHDVVAFLAAYSTKLPPGVATYIHDGLTSSDLVEYGLFQMLSEHSGLIVPLMQRLSRDGLARWDGRTPPSLRPGRTHGQIADQTTWEHQMAVLRQTFRHIRVDLADYEERAKVVKSPGPTGWPGANLTLFNRGIRVADELGCEMTLATQVINRDLLLQWAALYLRLACALENLALQIRLSARADVAEVREGASRVGSSAMPHKHNPIDSEKVCGMARIARGYFLSISEDVALWEDRDLTNSSLERIAVPGLAEIVEHMLRTMIDVMVNLQVDHQRMIGNATDPRARTNVMQVVAQELFGIGPIEASALVRLGISKDPNIPAAWTKDVYETIRDKGYDAEGWNEEVDRRIRERF